MKKQLYSHGEFLFWFFFIFYGLLLHICIDLGTPWAFSLIVKLYVYPIVFLLCIIAERNYPK